MPLPAETVCFILKIPTTRFRFVAPRLTSSRREFSPASRPSPRRLVPLGSERHDPPGGWRGTGTGRRRRGGAEPAEERSPAEEANGAARRPDVLRGGPAGAGRGAPGRRADTR